MSPSNIFTFGNTFVLLGWILLLALPKWKYTQDFVLKGIVLIIALLYAYMIGRGLSNFNPDSFSTLEKVKALFQNDEAVAAGWLHYLAFDLFVGAYIVKNSIENGIPRWIYSVILPFAFMFGPVGFVLYTLATFIPNQKAKSHS